MRRKQPRPSGRLTFSYEDPEQAEGQMADNSSVSTPLVSKGLRFPREHCLRALSDWSLFPKLLNISEASWLTQIPIKTLYKWSSEGKLRAVAKTIGKQLRFDRDALLRMWVNETKKATK